jgi:hypothetical protein
LRQLRDFAVTVLVLAVAGLVAGVLWSLAAPRAPLLVTAEGVRLADPSTQALIEADGWFAVITGVAGLACGVAGYLLSRRRPMPVLLGLAGGGVLAGFLARWLGGVVNVGSASVAAPAGGGTVVQSALTLTATGVLVSWPLLAVAVYGLLSAIATRDDPPGPHFDPPPAGGAFPGPPYAPPLTGGLPGTSYEPPSSGGPSHEPPSSGGPAQEPPSSGGPSYEPPSEGGPR